MNIVIESIKSHIKRIRESFVGQSNSIYTWNKVEQDISTYLDKLVSQNVIEPEYLCVCDATNNTPYTVSHNILVTSVFAKKDGQVHDVGGSTGQGAWEEAMYGARTMAQMSLRYFD